jgi:hypothetical protein
VEGGGARLIGTSSHGSMLSSALHLRSICAGRVSTERILLLAISTDAVLSLNGYDMVMGAFRENMGEWGRHWGRVGVRNTHYEHGAI